MRELAHSWVMDPGYEPKQSGPGTQILNHALLLHAENFAYTISLGLIIILLDQNNNYYGRHVWSLCYIADPVQTQDLHHVISS